MTSTVLHVHTYAPERRKICAAASSLRDGAVVLYPTDTGFALGCQLGNRAAIQRIRSLRRLPMEKNLTFLCGSLTKVAEFAVVGNRAYRTIKSLIPGPYTFILPASRMVPRFAQNPKRKTAGIRVPDNGLCQMLLEELGEPLLSISARPAEEDSLSHEQLVDSYLHRVDLILRMDEYDFVGQSTIIDMTTERFTVLREGAGMDRLLESSRDVA